jgi:hypothetical protein
MTHHSRLQYVGPATMSRTWQPERKTGRHASDWSMLFWSMHALSCGKGVGLSWRVGQGAVHRRGANAPARKWAPYRSSCGAAAPNV